MKKVIFFWVFLSINLFANETFTNLDFKADSLDLLIKAEKKQIPKAKLLLELANIKLEQFDKVSLELTDSAYKIAIEKNDIILKADCYYQYGRYWKYFDEYESAVNKLLEAIYIYEANGITDKIAESYRFIGETFRGSMNYQFAINYLNKAKNLFQKIKDNVGLARTYNRFAAVYFEMIYKDSNNIQFYDSLISHYNLSQKIALDSNWTDLIVSNYNIYGAAFANYRKSDSAKKYLLLAKKVAEENDLVIDIPMILAHLGNIALNQKKYELAVDFGRQSYAMSNKYNLVSYKQFSALLLAQAFKMTGNLDSAMYYTEVKYSDYTKIQNNMVESKVYNIKYKLNSEREKEVLKSKEDTIYYQTLSFIITSILAVFIILVMWIRFKSMKKANRILEEKNLTINQQREQLLELNKTKDKFFAIISHDLKNPIGAFKNSLDLANSIFDDFTREELKELIDELSKSSNSLYEMLDDLLNWSRSKQGIIRFEPITVNLYMLTDKVLYFVREHSKQKDILLEINIDENLEILSDVYLLHTVLRNLLSNSVKFTNSGGKITISYEDSNKFHNIIIKDSGVGIEKVKLDKLFKIEENSSSIGTAGEKGTGLGMILCKEYIEIHKGTLEVKSEINVGTEIKICLPKSYE